MRRVTVVLDINFSRLVEAYEKDNERPRIHQHKTLGVSEMLKDQLHWVKASGIKLKSIEKIEWIK